MTMSACCNTTTLLPPWNINNNDLQHIQVRCSQCPHMAKDAIATIVPSCSIQLRHNIYTIIVDTERLSWVGSGLVVGYLQVYHSLPWWMCCLTHQNLRDICKAAQFWATLCNQACCWQWFETMVQSADEDSNLIEYIGLSDIMADYVHCSSTSRSSAEAQINPK